MSALKIESGVELHSGYLNGEQHKLRETMRLMKVGDSFTYYDNTAPITAAKSVKIKVTTRKINGEGYRIWRIK